MAAQRDLRIDFFRGLALLIVVVDHVEIWSGHPRIYNWTLVSVGFSDAAEIFVFLSGYVLAIAYAQTLAQGGRWACLRKGLKRAVQIYAAYLLAAGTVIGIRVLSVDSIPPEIVRDGRVAAWAWEAALSALTLGYPVGGFEILAFYVVAVPTMALVLPVVRKAPWLAWLVSAGLYVAVQVEPAINFRRIDGAGWFFNPLAWQFLFFVGLYLGATPRRELPRSVRAVLLAAALAVVAFGVVTCKVVPSLAWDAATAEQLQRLNDACWSWAGKTALGPLRLMHFFALAYACARLLPARLPVWSSGPARPLAVCGQHSLEVYALGLVLAVLGVVSLENGRESTATILAVDAAVCALSIGFAYALRWWKQPRAAAAPRATSAPTGRQYVSRARRRPPARSRRRA
jgi:hypothetical protein